MTISTLKANQEDVRIPIRQRPPKYAAGSNDSRIPNPHSRTMSSSPREGTELAVPTILSSVHVYT